jgi:hypothetical protein
MSEYDINTSPYNYFLSDPRFSEDLLKERIREAFNLTIAPDYAFRDGALSYIKEQAEEILESSDEDDLAPPDEESTDEMIEFILNHSIGWSTVHYGNYHGVIAEMLGDCDNHSLPTAQQFEEWLENGGDLMFHIMGNDDLGNWWVEPTTERGALDYLRILAYRDLVYHWHDDPVSSLENRMLTVEERVQIGKNVKACIAILGEERVFEFALAQ